MKRESVWNNLFPFSGKFDFQEMRDANALAPLLFFVFVLTTSYILINLMLALILKSFEEVFMTSKMIFVSQKSLQISDIVWFISVLTDWS